MAAAITTQTPIEIIVVDDGSSDRTYSVAHDFSVTHNSTFLTAITIRQNPKTMGIGHNFREVAKLAQGEYYRMVCGDNVESVATHEAIFDAIGTADMIIPVYAQVANKPWYRMLLSNLFSQLINLASGNRVGYYNGSAVVKTSEVVKTRIRFDGFCFQAELLVQLLARGLSYRELTLTAVHHAESSALKWHNFKDAFFLFTDILFQRAVCAF